MSGTKRFFIFLLLFIAALAIRLFGISHGVTFHPDERHIIMTAERLSRADPNPHFFAYGSFPFYLLWGVGSFAGMFNEWWGQYDGLFIVGRTLAALFGALCVILTFQLAETIFASFSIGIIAALLVMLNPLHIQLSHFYAFDIVLCALNLAALLQMSKIARDGISTSRVTLVIVFWGLSLATKIGALWLGVPLFIALLGSLFRAPITGYRAAQYTLLAYLIAIGALLVFAGVEPYALLDMETFIRQNNEQIAFVRGLWRPPYGVQYETTTPFLFPLQQMWSFTVTQPIMACAALGIAYLGVKQYRKPDSPTLILLVWTVGFFLSIAGLKVKFLRYLIPIYPTLLICAAYGIQLAGRAIARVVNPAAARIAGAALLAWCVVLAGAQISVFRTEHPYYLASRWIYENVPDHSRIFQAHWDDTLPLHLPGNAPERFDTMGRDRELPLYEPDTEQKLIALAQDLSTADYIFFPTQRAIGSITKVPNEFRYTDALLRMLIKGDLGFIVEKQFKVQRKFLGITFPDDLADESFNVYSHPPIWILKNVAHFPAQEIQRRIENPDLFAPLPTREEILSGIRDTTDPAAGHLQLWDVLCWLLVVELIGVSTTVLFAPFFRLFPDRGLGVSRVAGFALFTILVWTLNSFGLVHSNGQTLWVVLGISVPIIWGLAMRSDSFRQLISARSARELLCAELVFLAGFLMFLGLRLANAEIFWGEKPMDFTFLNYFVRLETLPAFDPWAAGNEMKYYYLGTYGVALLHKLTGVDTAIGYNIALASLAGFFAGALYTLARFGLRRKSSAVFAAIAGLLTANLEVLRLLFVQPFIKGIVPDTFGGFMHAMNFDLFWASTRLFRSPFFAEYPSWSFIFADLHAHVIAIPLSLAVIASAVVLTSDRAVATGSRYWHPLMHGMLLGTLCGINTWDFLLLGLTSVVCMLFRPIPGISWAGGARATVLGSLLSRYFATGLLVGIGVAITAIPFWISTNSGRAIEWGWVTDEEFNRQLDLVKHFGIWLAAIGVALVFLFHRSESRALPMQIARTIAALIAGGLVALPAMVNSARGIPEIPWGIVLSAAVFAGIAVLFLWNRPGGGMRTRSGGALIVVASAAIVLVEMCFLMDRANTIFKFYGGLWLVLLSASVLLARSFIAGRRRAAAFRWIAISAVAIPLSIGLAGGILNFATMAGFKRTEQPSGTLNGIAYLSKQEDSEAPLIDWLRNNVEGLPTVLEAQGMSYAAFTRIAMHTGLPTVIGWEHHVGQRGTRHDDFIERAEAVRQIYNSLNVELAHMLLARYHVALIVVSKLEHETYSAAGLQKFEQHPELFARVYGDKTSAVYLVLPGGESQSGRLRLSFP